MGRRFVVAALTVLGASWAVAGASPPSASADYSVINALPLHYIANYDSRIEACRGFFDPLFVSWNSYDEAEVGDVWFVRASSKKLCRTARKAAFNVPDDFPYNGGSGTSKSDMVGYALNIGQHGTTDQRVRSGSAPRGMKCFALPSYWAESAWQDAQLAGHGSPGNTEFESASGVAAGAGYCVNAGARANKAGQWAKTPFIDWLPDPSDCKHRFRLHQEPDPDNPGELLPPPSYPDAQVFGSYDDVGC